MLLLQESREQSFRAIITDLCLKLRTDHCTVTILNLQDFSMTVPPYSGLAFLSTIIWANLFSCTAVSTGNSTDNTADT